MLSRKKEDQEREKRKAIGVLAQYRLYGAISTNSIKILSIHSHDLPININVGQDGCLSWLHACLLWQLSGFESKLISKIQNGNITMKEWPTLSSQPKKYNKNIPKLDY